MNANLKKIVELCDCEWIQGKEKVFIEPYRIWYSRRFDELHTIGSVGAGAGEVSGMIWLPIGFNPETGNWQVIDLFREAEAILDDIDRMEILNRLSRIQMICQGGN